MIQTDRTLKVMQLAEAEAQALGHKYLGTEHILLGLLREGSGVAANVLLNMGVKLETLREETLQLLGREEVDTNSEVEAVEKEHQTWATKVIELEARVKKLEELYTASCPPVIVMEGVAGVVKKDPGRCDG